VLIGLLPSNGCPVVESVCFGDVFTEPLPSNWHMRHNTIILKIESEEMASVAV
jgi:hypothetical protein